MQRFKHPSPPPPESRAMDRLPSFPLARREVVGGLAATMAIASSPSSAAPSDRPASGGTIKVPLDHFRLDAGQVDLQYEWGAPYRRERPTVLLVADAQQFYLRPGAATDLQTRLFGPDLNVLALFGRASSSQVKNFVRPNRAVDWDRAARVLNIHQWIGDIRSTADELGLNPNLLGLYGRSGGADLVLRFLAAHPARAARAYVQAAVVHDLQARWGLSADRFWEQLSSSDPRLADRLSNYLLAAPDHRREAIMLLQRQNFYESIDELGKARSALIEAIITQNRAAIADYRDRYQLNAIEELNAAGENLSSVRLHEFSRAYRDPRGTKGALRPDIESIFYYAEPVDRALYDAQVPLAPAKLDGLRQTATEVLIAAGKHDHTADYRAQVALAGLIPRSELLLLDDDHVFKRLTASGRHPAVLQAFFADGLESPRFRNALDALAPLKSDETQ